MIQAVKKSRVISKSNRGDIISIGFSNLFWISIFRNFRAKGSVTEELKVKLKVYWCCVKISQRKSIDVDLQYFLEKIIDFQGGLSAQNHGHNLIHSSNSNLVQLEVEERVLLQKFIGGTHVPPNYYFLCSRHGDRALRHRQMEAQADGGIYGNGLI